VPNSYTRSLTACPISTTPDFLTNRDLFSNYYLAEHLPETEAWDEASDEEVRTAMEDIREQYREEYDRVDGYNEAQLERELIRPVFERLGISFEIEESVAEGQRRPDYAFFTSDDAREAAFDQRDAGGDFYKNAIAVADAKRWDRKLDTRGEKQRDFENPSYQIHVYLQETPTQWAVLTNGRTWRLYYGPTSHRLDSYYEIDLPAALERDSVEAFRYFYLFFRKAAFVADQSGDCFLDDVKEESNTFAEALGEDLQDNIYEAIRVLAEGFIDTNDDLGEADLDLIHDSSLIYLYRLIFVFYAESEGRELLPADNDIYSDSYSLNERKQVVAERLDDPDEQYVAWRTALWDQLGELFDLINEGSAGQGIPEDQLYIPAYNGGLFRTNPDEDDSVEAQFLATHEVGDAYLAEVIDLLARRESEDGAGMVFVDYSSLDVRHLGSIYEGLLEYQLNLADEDLTTEDGEYASAGTDDDVVVPAGNVYLTTDAGERKATGSYYTPEYVVEYIVEETLEPLVDEIREDLVGQSARGDQGFAEEFAERVFGLKILDPAMGSGHFLTSAIDYLAREIIDAQERQAAQQGIETVDETHDINWARRKVAQRCIYVVDVNPLAVELAKVSLWLRTLAAEQPLAFLDHHLKTGNSLVGSDVTEVLSEDEEASSGQITLTQAFARVRQQTLDHVMDLTSELLAVDNETLADMKTMEATYDEIRDDPLYRRLFELVNVHTAERFGCDVPDGAYEEMAGAIEDAEDWAEVHERDWFRAAQTIAGEEQFFHWELEFPEAFFGMDGGKRADAGFDAVVGNPPYVDFKDLTSDVKRAIEPAYRSCSGKFDLYIPFIEQSISVSARRIGFVVPSMFMRRDYGDEIRQVIIENSNVDTILDFGSNQVFGDATNFTCIQILDKQPVQTQYTGVNELPLRQIIEYTKDDYSEVAESAIGDHPWSFISKEEADVLDKIRTGRPTLKTVTTGIRQGLVTSKDEVYVLHEDELDAKQLERELWNPLVKGEDVNRWTISDPSHFVFYPYDQDNNLIQEKELERSYPKTYQYIDQNRSKLSGRSYYDEAGLEWFELWRPRTRDVFEDEKILVREIADYNMFAIDTNGYYFNTKSFGIHLAETGNIHYLTGILNSKVAEVQLKEESVPKRGGYYEYNTQFLNRISIERNPPEQEETKIIELVQEIAEAKRLRERLKLRIEDHIGNSYPDGPTLTEIGLTLPPENSADSILQQTTEQYPNLRVDRAEAVRKSDSTVEIRLTARYKPEESGTHDGSDPDSLDTDQWGYAETGPLPALRVTDLESAEADLIEHFVPRAVGKSGGFANFRETATKTNSLVDRLRALTLPELDDVRDGLENYLEVKERAEELDEQIERTDDLIDEIVYDLYGLTDEEIEIVEEAVGDD